jgi:hypothetical protein
VNDVIFRGRRYLEERGGGLLFMCFLLIGYILVLIRYMNKYHSFYLRGVLVFYDLNEFIRLRAKRLFSSNLFSFIL